MARRRKRQGRLDRLGTDILGMVASARDASKTALQHLRREITATRKRLEKLVGEERSFRPDLFGTAAPARPQKVGRPPSIDIQKRIDEDGLSSPRPQ